MNGLASNHRLTLNPPLSLWPWPSWRTLAIPVLARLALAPLLLAADIHPRSSLSPAQPLYASPWVPIALVALAGLSGGYTCSYVFLLLLSLDCAQRLLPGSKLKQLSTVLDAGAEHPSRTLHCSMSLVFGTKPPGDDEDCSKFDTEAAGILMSLSICAGLVAGAIVSCGLLA
jgi:hypothetical protein